MIELQFNHWKHGPVVREVEELGGGLPHHYKDRVRIWYVSPVGNEVYDVGSVVNGETRIGTKVHIGSNCRVVHVVDNPDHNRHIGTFGIQVARAFADTLYDAGEDPVKLGEMMAMNLYDSAEAQQAFSDYVYEQTCKRERG